MFTTTKNLLVANYFCPKIFIEKLIFDIDKLAIRTMAKKNFAGK